MNEGNNLSIDLVSSPKKSFWKLAIPILCFVLFSAVYGLIDLYWVSKLDAQSFYAVSVSLPLFTLICAMGDSIGQGTNSLMSRSIGAKDYENAYRAIFHGIIICVIVWFFIMLCIPFLDDLLIFAGLNKSIDLTLRYLVPTFLFSIFFILPNFFSETLQSEGDSKRPTIIIILGNVLNLVLDPILIFYFNLGVGGAAYSTIMSSLITTMVFIYLYASKRTKVPIHFRFSKLNRHVFYEITNVAFPNFIIDSLFCTISVFINGVLIRDLGQIGVLLYSTSIKIQDILITPLKGYGRGLMCVSAQLFGSRKIKELKEFYLYVLKVSTATMMVIYIVFVIFRDPIYHSFSIWGMESGVKYIAIFGTFIILTRVFLVMDYKIIDAFGKSYYNLVFTVIFIFLQIALISILDFIIPYGSSVLIGILIAQVIMTIAYEVFIMHLFKKFEKEIGENTLAVI